MSHGAGKGDKPRPVNKKVYDDNYDLIFNKNTKNKKNKKINTRDLLEKIENNDEDIEYEFE